MYRRNHSMVPLFFVGEYRAESSMMLTCPKKDETKELQAPDKTIVFCFTGTHNAIPH